METKAADSVPVLFVAARDDLYGASRAALAIGRHLPRHGFRPLLVSPERGPLAQAFTELGPVTSGPVGSGRSLWARVSRGWALRPVARWAATQGVKLIVAITLSAAPAARSLARALGRPWVLHLRNIYASRGRESPYLKYGAPEATAVVAASEHILEEYRNSGAHRPGQPTSVVLDGLELTPALGRVRAREELGLSARAKVMGTCGAVSPQKNTLFAAQLLSELPELTLVVLGDGAAPYSEEVRCLPRVQYQGFRHDAPALLSAFDVLLHPSRAEALGLAPLEAMAAGVPVIASNVGGLPEALGDGAVLLPPDDRAAWVRALRQILEDEPFREALIARGRAQAARMTAEVAAAKTAAIYRELIG